MDIKISNTIHSYDVYNKALKGRDMHISPLKQENDKLLMSSKAREFNLAWQEIGKYYDGEREKKINQLKSKVEQNSYHISAEEMAEKLIDTNPRLIHGQQREA